MRARTYHGSVEPHIASRHQIGACCPQHDLHRDAARTPADKLFDILMRSAEKEIEKKKADNDNVPTIRAEDLLDDAA